MFWRVKPIETLVRLAEDKPLRRSLGAWQLVLLGIGAIIGTGIFVLVSQAAQKAGPGMMLSFVIAGAVCVVAGLCYAEMSSLVPVSGSAYTYTYAVMGEALAWVVGWALILEYALAASAVAVGWSGYVTGLLDGLGVLHVPIELAKGLGDGGIVNLPAAVLALAVTGLLVVGTRESALVNSVLVAVKLVALVAFVALSVPAINTQNFAPFAPTGFVGISAAAASIFFAFVGFDAVATASEETVNPQRNIPIGIMGSLAVCTIFYLFVAAGVIGTVGTQPLMGPDGVPYAAGSIEMAAACKAHTQMVVCSGEPLAFVLRMLDWNMLANLLGLAVGFALPSVVLLMMFAQTRIFFVISRDGLLPPVFARVHSRFRTPHVITLTTGALVAALAAFVPLGKLADLANAGTLLAFAMVAVAVLRMRVVDAARPRPFRTPAVWIVAPLACGGCLYLFFSLGLWTKLLMLFWAAGGLVVYGLYGYRHSHLAKGKVEPGDLPDAPPGTI